MRISILAASALAALVLVPNARAETAVIERRDAPVEASTVVEKRTVETTGSTACRTKTTKTTNEFGDTKTVSKERCD